MNQLSAVFCTMELRDFTIALYDISEYAYLIVGCYALWKSIQTGKHKWLACFLLVVGVIRTVSIFLADDGINTMYLYHLIGLLELVFAYTVYQKKIQRWWLPIVAFLVGCYVLNSLFRVSLFGANNIGWALVQFVILLFSFSYLFVLYRDGKETNLGRSAFFYFNAGFMIYASGSFFVNLLSSEIVSESTNGFFNNAWIIEACVALARLSFFIIGLQFVKHER